MRWQLTTIAAVASSIAIVSACGSRSNGPSSPPETSAQTQANPETRPETRPETPPPAQQDTPHAQRAETPASHRQSETARATPRQTAPVPRTDAPEQATIVRTSDMTLDNESGFAANAFPPTLPDAEWHREAWTRQDCLACHETGVGDAPIVRHKGLPAIALKVKCRSCHVLIPGKTEARPASERQPEINDLFAEDAFPPMMPNTPEHSRAWGKNDCLICHEQGIAGAPIVDHGERIPKLALMVKCRTCHVQVRSTDTSPWK